jgi:hypothetical protein
LYLGNKKNCIEYKIKSLAVPLLHKGEINPIPYVDVIEAI